MAFSTHDIVPDSPTNNFATMNVLTEPNVTTGNTFSDGNLKLAFSTAAGVFPSLLGSIAIPNDTGVWYWEVHYTTTTFNGGFGIYNENTGLTTDYGGTQAGLTDAGFVLFAGSSLKKVYLNTITEIVSSLSSPIILQLIFDAVNRKLFIKYNDTEPSGQSISSGTSLFPVFSAGKTYIPAFYHGDGGSGTKSGTFVINHGQDPSFAGNKSPSTTYTDANGIGAFYYQPPTGALALCTANLPDFTPTVTGDTPQDYFKAVTYDGDETNGVSEDLGFRPDMIWVKARNINYNHILIDSLRPHSDPDSYYRLHPDLSNSQADYNDNIYITNTGFECGSQQSGVNENNKTFVAWCWKAAGAPADNQAKIINEDGSAMDATAAEAVRNSGSIVPSKISANRQNGFSIVSYTGPGNGISGTLPHGLGKEPKFVITKSTNNTYNWMVYHKSAGVTHYSEFNEANIFYNNNTVHNGPHDANFVKYGGTAVVALGEYIAYIWAEISGYSKFGSYVGNGSADGPFVYCGFRPAWIMCKCTTASNNNWVIRDSKRDGYNSNNLALFSNTADQEPGSTWNPIDILSNGFRIRATGTDVNSTNETYIFMAFAEQPFKFSNAR